MKEIVESLTAVSSIDAMIREETNYGELKKHVVSCAILLTSNLSYEERLEVLKAASKKKGDGEYSRFYLSFGVEAILASHSCDFDVDVKVYSYDPSINLSKYFKCYI